MSKELPVKLKKEPLIDAIFEVRFSTDAPASDILPGFLFSQLDGIQRTVEKLPASEIPKPVRDLEPHLKFSSLIKLDWGKFVISIGDRNLVVGCKLPYPGWGEFKPSILKIIKLIDTIKIIKSVNRFSMKYIDLIPSESLEERIAMINASITLGEHSLKDKEFFLRTEIPEKDIVHVISITSSGKARLSNGDQEDGVVIDTDTICNLNDIKFSNWNQQLSKKLDEVHDANKKMFFQCVQPEAIKSLEPIYE